MRIRLQVSGILLYALNAMDVQDVVLHDDKDREWLEVIISQWQSITLLNAVQAGFGID